LFRGALPRPGHPTSYRWLRARGPGTSRVPEPAPLRVRSRRGLSRTARIPSLPLVRDTWRPAHRCRSRSSSPRASNAGRRFLRARSRVSSGFAWERPAGVATGDASDRRLHSETVPTRALVLRRFPARPSARTMPCDTARGLPSFRSLAAPCSFPRMSVSRAVLTRPRTGAHVHRRLGAIRCERGWGELRFTTGPSLRRPAGVPRGVFFLDESSGNGRLWHPCRLLFPARPSSRFIEHRALVQRPPRPVPRGPRERRALLRSGMPSVDSCYAQHARAGARSRPRNLLRDHGAHVMRIAASRKTTLFLPDGAPERLHVRARPPVRLPVHALLSIGLAFDHSVAGGALL